VLVVEIGPGGGVLTRELVGAGARVAAIELDLDWAATLAMELASGRMPIPEGDSRYRVSVAVADALELDWRGLVEGSRVAGNLPYNVGTEIVRRLLAGVPVGTVAGFLLQREVVDRLTAVPGDAAYGALSVLVAARARASLLGRVRAGAFVPAPEVESAFVGLETISPPLPEAEMPAFERLVRAAFGQRRKRLRNALAVDRGRAAADALLAAARLPADVRAEALGLQEFVALHRAGGEAAELHNSQC
jgi:16S rRNA (adenine1518-N6/adenine1519-N6)-dimethyltransferase